jgi:hypothetical protein
MTSALSPHPEPSSPLDSLTSTAKKVGAKGPPPVHLWHPPFCGDIDMRIASDGTWYYLGTPIGRPALVKLFASILRKDPDRFVLVTPVEMVGITVEDAPFLAVALSCEESDGVPRLTFRTNVDDVITAGPDHPIRFEEESSGGLKPYVRVRGDLWAKLTRAIFYDLVAQGQDHVINGVRMFGVASDGAFFPMIEASRLADL